MINEQNQPITQEALEAAGYQRREYTGNEVVEYWRTYRPLMATKRRPGYAVAVTFRNNSPGMVWVRISDSMTQAPRVRTMQQLERLLWLLTDGGDGTEAELPY